MSVAISVATMIVAIVASVVVAARALSPTVRPAPVRSTTRKTAAR
jgi:hypothetical protein